MGTAARPSGYRRWAFATKKPWAREKAHRTKGGPKIRYRRLPGRKGVRKKM